MDNQKIIDDVRFITGYPELVFSDEKVQDAIDFTIDEMKSMLDDPEREFEGFRAERAVMWGTCYHLKVKTGEIGGIPMSIGDVNLSSINDSGDNPDVFSWVKKFHENFHRIQDAPLGFGSANPTREDRDYTNYDTADYGG